MKNSKTFLLLSVVVAVLVLGIAYAALTQDLTITANATVAPDASNFNVAFDSASITAITSEGKDVTSNETYVAKVTTAASGVTTASLVIAEGALVKVDDYVEVEYTVKNSSKDLTATMGNITVTPKSNNTYVQFTAEYKNADDKSLEKLNGTTVIVVRATLIKAPNEQKVTATADVTFNATAAEA